MEVRVHNLDEALGRKRQAMAAPGSVRPSRCWRRPRPKRTRLRHPRRSPPPRRRPRRRPRTTTPPGRIEPDADDGDTARSNGTNDADSANPAWIFNVRGVGYRMARPRRE